MIEIRNNEHYRALRMIARAALGERAYSLPLFPSRRTTREVWSTWLSQLTDDELARVHGGIVAARLKE